MVNWWQILAALVVTQAFNLVFHDAIARTRTATLRRIEKIRHGPRGRHKPIDLKLVEVGKARPPTQIFLAYFDALGFDLDQQFRCQLVNPEPALYDVLTSRDNWAAVANPDNVARKIQAETARLENNKEDSAFPEWNGQNLALNRITYQHKQQWGGLIEWPFFELQFRHGDYAATKVLGPLWASTCSAVDMADTHWERVMPGWSHNFGVNATVETSDGYLLLVRRSEHTRTYRNHLHASMNETMRSDDVVTPGDRQVVPSIMRAYMRGFDKELGLSEEVVRGGQLTVHTLGLELTHYEWGLLAHLEIKQPLRKLRLAPDAEETWEHGPLQPVEFEAKKLERWLFNDGPWVPHGALNVVLSAIVRHKAPRSWLERLSQTSTRHPSAEYLNASSAVVRDR